MSDSMFDAYDEYFESDMARKFYNLPHKLLEGFLYFKFIGYKIPQVGDYYLTEDNVLQYCLFDYRKLVPVYKLLIR